MFRTELRLLHHVFTSMQALSEENYASTRTIRRTVQMIKWYPIIAIGVWTIPIIYRFGQACGWSNHVIDDIRGFMFFIQGFLDALVFCYYAPVFDLWKEAVVSLFDFKSKKIDNAIVKTAAVHGGEVSPSITGLMNGVVPSSSVPSSAATDDEFWTVETSKNISPGNRYSFGIEKHDV